MKPGEGLAQILSNDEKLGGESASIDQGAEGIRLLFRFIKFCRGGHRSRIEPAIQFFL
jgi:hypothetical protein